MSDQDELSRAITAFASLDDAESVPLLTTLGAWRGELDARAAELSSQAILLAARFEALIAQQDAYFAQRVAFDREVSQLELERADYAEAFARLQGMLLGAAMRFRDREAHFSTTLASIEIIEE